MSDTDQLTDEIEPAAQVHFLQAELDKIDEVVKDSLEKIRNSEKAVGRMLLVRRAIQKEFDLLDEG